MHDKELIVSPEMPDNMAQQLASDKFKKMVCGEIVAVPIKHAVAETVKWRVPMLMCGNDYPRYRDERGSVSKRLAIFCFTRYVDTQDSSLKHRIITEELSRLVVKCLLAYRLLLERTGTDGFWTRCPAYLKENTSSMHETSDYVHMPLTLGLGDNSWYDRVANARKVMYSCSSRAAACGWRISRKSSSTKALPPPPGEAPLEQRLAAPSSAWATWWSAATCAAPASEPRPGCARTTATPTALTSTSS